MDRRRAILAVWLTLSVLTFLSIRAEAQCGGCNDEGVAYSCSAANAADMEGDSYGSCVAQGCEPVFYAGQGGCSEGGFRATCVYAHPPGGGSCGVAGNPLMGSYYGVASMCEDQADPAGNYYWPHGGSSSFCIAGCAAGPSGTYLCTGGTCAGPIGYTGATCLPGDGGGGDPDPNFCDDPANADHALCACDTGTGGHSAQCLCDADPAYCGPGTDPPGGGDGGGGDGGGGDGTDPPDYPGNPGDGDGGGGDGGDGSGPGYPGGPGGPGGDPGGNCDPATETCEDGGAGGTAGGVFCEQPPVCEDPNSIDCAALFQEWRFQCQPSNTGEAYSQQLTGLDEDITAMLDSLFENEDATIEAPSFDEGGFIGGSCPGTLSVTALGAAMAFDTTPLCTLAQIIGLLVVIAATLTGVGIVVRSF